MRMYKALGKSGTPPERPERLRNSVIDSAFSVAPHESI